MSRPRCQFRPTGSTRNPTVSSAETVTQSIPNTSPHKSPPPARRNRPPVQQLKRNNTNAVSNLNKPSSAVHPAPEVSASRAEALTSTRQSLTHTAASSLSSTPETASKSSGRHKERYGTSRKGEKPDTLSTPLVQAQETKHDPEPVALRPTKAPLSRKKEDEEPRVIQPTKAPGKKTSATVVQQPAKDLFPPSPSPRDVAVTSDWASSQPPTQAKNKESSFHQELSAPLTTVAQDAVRPGKPPVQAKQAKREAKTKLVPSQPVTPEPLKPFEAEQRPKTPIKPHSKTKSPPDTPSTDYFTAPERSPIEPTRTSPLAPLPERPVAQRRDKTFEVALPSAQVRFTDGMQVHCITTHHESTRIVLKGWPSDLTEENIKWYLRSYGKIHFVSVTRNDSGEKIAHVRFSQHQEAVAALREIEEGTIELGPWPNRVTAAFDTSIAPTLKGTNILSNTVVLSWTIPKPKLKVFYYTPEQAAYWAKRICRWTRDGQQLVAKVRRAKEVGVPARTVVVENLPENTNITRFGSIIRADDRPGWLPNHYDHDIIIAEVRKVIDSSARDVSFDQNGDRVTFRCILHNSEDTKAFMALVNKQEWPWKGPARFQMTEHIKVLYTIPFLHFMAVGNQLEELRTKFSAMGVSMQVTTPPGADTVRHILISGGLGVRGGKHLMDRLLAGEAVRHDGKVLWDEDVDSFYGASVLAVIGVPRAYISINRRNQSYTVHGPLYQREEAAKLLIGRVRQAKLYLNVHNFPRNQLRWWSQEGLHLIKGRVEERDLWLDPIHCRITVRGGGPARGILHRCTNIARNSWHPPPRPVTGGSLFCPACFEVACDPVRIRCKHVYCRDCFTAFLASTARHGSPLPIKCFGDDGKCPQLVSMWEVRNFMQKADLQRLATKALEIHVSRKQDELRYCPTPGCAYIYRVQKKITEPPVPEIPKGSKSKQPKGNARRADTSPGVPNPKADIPSATIQCPGCLVRICAGCHSVAHERRTCDSVQVEKEKNDKLFQAWLKTSGAKHCPKCSIPLLKDGGCNHVLCGACRTHICWVCLKAFKDSGEKESVYEHIRRMHGGSVFGDAPVVAWEALPEDIDEATALVALGVDEDLPKVAPAIPRTDYWEWPPPPPPPSKEPKKEPLPAHVVHGMYRPSRRRGGVMGAGQAENIRKGRRRLRERGDPTWNPRHFMEYEYPEDESDDPIVWPKQPKTYECEHEIPDWWEYEDYDYEWL